MKYVEEGKNNQSVRELKEELHEAVKMIAFAKAGGSFDLHAASRMLKDYEQAAATTSSSSSSAAAALPLSEQAARGEATTVRTVDPTTDLAIDGDNNEFVILTGNEM